MQTVFHPWIYHYLNNLINEEIVKCSLLIFSCRLCIHVLDPSNFFWMLTILCLSTWSLSITLLVFLLYTGSSTDWRPISIMTVKVTNRLKCKLTYCFIARLVSFSQPPLSAFQTLRSHCLQLWLSMLVSSFRV